MKAPSTASLKKQIPSSNPSKSARGFALIATISMMVLLVMIALAMLSLSTIELRSSQNGKAMAEAQANARLALMIALGELQKSTGSDQRITMTSGLRTGGEPENPNWTGSVDVSPSALTQDTKNAPIRWLVSGEQPDPATALKLSPELNTGDALKLGTFITESQATKDLLAPVVNINQGTGRTGRYAWWISDEGVKARVDLAKLENAPAAERERLALSQTPLEPGLAKLSDAWAEFAPLPVGTIAKDTLISMETTSLAAQSPSLSAEYFNDLTTGGFGLPVNVTAGGMKADLSLIFDKSQVSKNFGKQYMGAKPTSATLNGASLYNFAHEDPDKFFLSDAITESGTIPTGPNWGILWNYATLWQNINEGKAPVVSVNPKLETDLRYKDWLPYTNSSLGKWRKDSQHTNSPLTPVLSVFQMSFRLSSEKVDPPADQPTLEQYKAQITIQPVIGIWNPHNVAIRTTPYVIRWALYPYFRLNFAKPGSGSFTDQRFTELWLREKWVKGSGNGFFPTPDNPQGSKFIAVTTEEVDLQPGEFRIFSARDKVTNTQVTDSYKLKPGWSEDGGFVIDLDAAPVPKGYRAWFGDIVLEDTQRAETLARYPGLDPTKTNASWISVGNSGPSGSRYFLRTSGLWNSSNNPNVMMPEPVVSGADGTGGTSKPTYAIEDIADGSVAAHIATWSFFTRTTNQVEEESQRLRGWIDSNPRALATNPLWDGSNVSSSGESSGWHTTSQWIGADNGGGESGVIGDGLGGNRGLLAEGGSAIPEPEMKMAGGRYQGYGGGANTLAGGTTHSIVFDVPRSPLISLGQFQHAQLSRYNHEPGFVFGNSYANPRIPLDSVNNQNFNGISGFNVTDISYDVNKKLWDGYFFSTLGLDYVGGTGSFDSSFDLKKLASGEDALPNPRMIFRPLDGDTTIDKILADNGDRAPEAIAARIRVKGAFNVNSTSKTAWKAVLSSMAASELPTLDPQTNAVSWSNPGGTRFNRFGHVLSNRPYEKGGAGDDDPFWQGWRNISEAELDELAENIVKEVKERGPFRSMAEFVNRNPDADDTRHRLKGALQAALDSTINKGLPESVGKPATSPIGPQFSAAVTDENVAVGSASYLMQGDVLQSLAPILQVRSDYFRIRTCGEALDGNGKVTARAWCEAYVQRRSSYVDPLDQAHKKTGELASTTNQTFGRRYAIISFRWLSPSEL